MNAVSGHVGAMLGLCGIYVFLMGHVEDIFLPFMLGPCLGSLEPCWGHVGPMLNLRPNEHAFFGLGRGHVGPILSLSWAYVDPRLGPGWSKSRGLLAALI